MGKVAILSFLLMAACAVNDSYCTVDRPIFLGNGDVERLSIESPLVRQIVIHNEKYEAICGS